MKLKIILDEKNWKEFKGEYLKAEVDFVSKTDREKRVYSHTKVGDVAGVDISVINLISVLDTDPISALEIFKEEVEELIKILKDKQNEKTN